MTCGGYAAGPAGRRLSSHVHIWVTLVLLGVVAVTGTAARADLLASASADTPAQPTRTEAR